MRQALQNEQNFLAKQRDAVNNVSNDRAASIEELKRDPRFYDFSHGRPDVTRWGAKQIENLGRSVSLGNPYREQIVQLGHALEVAQQRVDRLAASTKGTGVFRLVDQPGRSLKTLMREQGDEQPFYVPDSAHTSGLRSRFSARPSGFTAPEQGVKQSRGVLFSRALINFNGNALANEYRRFATQARAQLIHDELVKHAAILPKGEPIPHGYEELPLNRGQVRASYTERAMAPLEHELSNATLRDRLASLAHASQLPDGWNRHLTSSVVRLALERPQVLDALYQTGQEGKPLSDAILAALPSYLHGSLGVHLPSWLGGEAGKQELLTMTSLNPFSTLLDEGNILGARFHKAGASSDASPLSPYAQMAIEQLTGTNLLTGHPLHGNAITHEAENLTPLQGILRDLIHGGHHPSPTATNQNNELGQLLRYLGLPVENVNRP